MSWATKQMGLDPLIAAIKAHDKVKTIHELTKWVTDNVSKLHGDWIRELLMGKIED